MTVRKLTTIIFLGILLFSTLLSLSVYVLKLEYCALRTVHGGSLCDVVNRLSSHNLFGTAIMVLIVVFVFLYQATPLHEREQRLNPKKISSSAPIVGFLSPQLIAWLQLRYNSPNII